MEQPGFRIAAVAVPLLLAPPLVLLLASLVQPLFVDRYVFYSAAAIPLLAGAGLDRLGRLLPRPWVGWLAGLLVVVVVFAAQWGPLRAVRTIDSRSDDLAGAARVVAAGARPGDGVVFMPTKYRAAALGYPKDFQEVHDLAMAETPIQASNLRGVDKSRRQTRAAMLSTQRIWVIGRPGLKVGSGEKGAVTERDTLTADFRKVQQVDVDGLEIALFVRR